MNRSYRLVWNERIGAWVVASERARARGKRSGAVRAGVLVCLLGASTAWAVDPAALPTGGQIVSGSGSISQNGAAMTVNQGSDKLIANWNSFNIGSQASVNFAQPGAASVALNRVLGSDPSYLFGHLTANGQVFLINPSGVIFGPSARVDVGGLVASTLGLGDQDFLSGSYRFANAGGAGSVLNQGRISGKVVALLGPRVSNQGSIAAPGGTVALAAGDRVSLDFAGEGLLTANVQQAAVNALAENKGLIQADGGTVVMTAKSAGDLLATVVNNEGIIQAHGIVQRNGRILLDGGDTGVTRAAGTLDVSNADGSGGRIVATGDKVLVDEGARLDATGKTGGGEIFVGGGWQGGDPSIRQATSTTVAATATLDASATGNGNGGTVVAWSDIHNPGSATRAWGTFLAKGGADGGNGGRIETSGHWLNAQGAKGSAIAPHGTAGMWLFDPYDVSISSANANGGFSAGTWTPTADTSTILNTDINNLLEGGTSVTVTTGAGGAQAGDISVDSAITKASGNTDVTLTLQAANSILVNNAIANTGGTGKLNVVLNSDSDGSGTGGILMTSGTSIITNGGNIMLSGGTDPATGYAQGAVNTGDRGIWTQQNTMLDASGAASGGNIVLRGAGTVTGEGMLIGWGGTGPASTIKTNGTGTISMNGIGGGQSSGRWVTGTSIWNTAIQTDSGAINITGTGGAADGTDDNSGVMLNTNGVTTDNRIVSSSGPINITGVRGTGTTSTGAGIWFGAGSHAIGQDGTLVASSSSNITLQADTLQIDSGMLQSSGALAIEPYGAGTTIGVGDGASGTLNLAGSELDKLADGFSSITIGGATGSGAVDVRGYTFKDPLTIRTPVGSGNITVNGALATGSASQAGSITLQAGDRIALASSSSITTQGQAVVADANADASGGGAIAITSAAISTHGGAITLGGGATPATVAASGTSASHHGVGLSGATLDSAGGDITIRGAGYAADGASGVDIGNASQITSGAGNVLIDGSGAGGGGNQRRGIVMYGGSKIHDSHNISLYGSADATATDYNTGIDLDGTGGSSITGDGAIYLEGHGGGTGLNGHGISAGADFTTSASGSGTLTLLAVGSSGQTGNGIFYHGTLSTVSGDVSITATGHAAHDSTGLYLHDGSTVSSTSGKVTINATGSGSSGATYGFQANPGAAVYSQSGAVDVSAVAGTGSPALYLNNATLGYASGTGSLTLSADTMSFASSSTIQGNSALLIQPLTAGTTIGLGDSAGGTLNLDNTELGYLHDGFSSITIGRSDGSGAVDVRSHSFNDPLTIRTPVGAGNITVNGALATGSASQAGSITLQAGNNVTLAASSSITTQGQAVTLDADADASTVGTVTLNSGSSIASNGGNIILGGGTDPATGYAAGAKAVWLNGTSVSSGGGDILLRGKGRGANGSADTPGIKIESSTVDSGSGAVTLVGDSFDGSAGIFLAANASITSAKTNGTAISVTGNAGQTVASDNSPGLLMIDASLTATGSGGDIVMNGLGGVSNTSGNTFNAKGIAIAGGAGSTIQAEGTLTMTGTARADVGDNSIGISIENYAGNIGAKGGITITGNSQKAGITDVQLRQDSGSNTLGNSTTSSITLIGDRIALAVGAGTTAIQTAANGSVSLLGRTAGRTVSVGAADSATVLGIDNTELNRITTGSLFIGRDYGDATAAGVLSVDGALGFSAAKLPAVFLRGIDITLNQGITKNAGGDAALNVQASNSITLNAGGDITATAAGKLAVTLNSDRDASGSGAITLASGAAVASNGGDITLRGGNAALGALSDPTVVANQSAFLSSPGLQFTSARGDGANSDGVSLNNATLDAGGGNIEVRGIGADGHAGMTINGGSTVKASGTGSIALYGAGGGSGSENDGVNIGGDGTSVTTADGGITMYGLGRGATSGQGVIVQGAGNTTPKIESANGDIAIRGASQATAGANQGVYVGDGAHIDTTGTGNIDIAGRGSGAGTDSHGVFVVNAGVVQTTGGGSLALTGYGSSAGASNNNEGVKLMNGSLAEVQTGAGNLTVNGTGGSGTNYNIGVNALNSTFRMGATATGAMMITGQGGAASGTGNWGVLLENGGIYESLGAASIALNGTGGTGTDNAGLKLTGGTTNRIGSSTMTGTITLASDTVDFNGVAGGTMSVKSSGVLTVRPLTAATTIGVAGGAGTLQLPAAYFNGGVFSNSLSSITVGASNAGALTVGGATTFGTDTRLASGAGIAINGAIGASGHSVTLTGGSGSNVSGNGNITASKLLLDGGGASYLLNTATANSVGTLAATGVAAVDFKNSGSLTVGTVGAVDGVGASGDVTLEAAGASADLTVDKPVTSAGGTIIASAGRNFINATTTDTGLAPGSGRYLVYSTNPSSSTEGMTGYNKHYNQAYSAGSTPSYAGSGNWFLYSVAPVLSVAPGAQTVTYGDATPGFTSSYSGLIDGDTGGTAGISGTASFSIGGATSAAGKYTAGNHDVNYVSGLASSLGYQFQDDSGSTSELTVNPKPLTAGLVGAISKRQDGSDAATLSSANFKLDGFIAGEGAAVTQTAGRYDNPNAGTGKTVTALLASGDFNAGAGTLLSNYVLPTAASGAIGSITSSSGTSLGSTLSDATVNQAHAVDTAGANDRAAGSAAHAGFNAGVQPGAGGSGNLVMNNVSSRSGGMTLSTNDGVRPVAFSESGGATMLDLGGSGNGSRSESALQVYVTGNGGVQPLKRFNVVDRGDSLALEPAPLLRQAAPDIAGIDGAATTASLTLPDGAVQELRIRLSQDGILLVRLPNGGLHDLKEQQVVLLALATAKGNLGMAPGRIKAVVIAATEQ
jgi:filamentous hemagglutinin family protein